MIEDAVKTIEEYSPNDTDDLVTLLLVSQKHYEAKLKELMGEKEFKEFATEVAKKMYLDWVEHLPDGDFKNYAFDHYEEITK